MNPTSEIVANGMKRVCADFTSSIESRGFIRTKDRLWVRLQRHCAETIHVHRRGSTYGAPITPSVDLRVELGILVLNDLPPKTGILQYSDTTRRHTGHVYHHRFNALTWSTYDRCLHDLELFVAEYAEPWFEEWREPSRLAAHPTLHASSSERIAEAVHGQSDSAASLKALGLIGAKLARARTATAN